jgi:hypothetical protein
VSAPRPPEDDAAWVKVEMPLPPAALHEFLLDIERLFRINPWLEFERIERPAAGRLRLFGRNHSNSQPLEIGVSLAESFPGRSLVLSYDKGIKRETRLEIDAAPAGSVLTITETYDTPSEGQREERLKEVDHSLLPWAAALRDYLRNRARWAWLPGHRWYLERFWLGMTPRQRRIVRLLVWTTVAEFVVFLFVFAIYWNEAWRA